MVEMVMPDGTLGMVPIDMDPTRLIRSRIDVVDLQTCTAIGSQWRDELLIGFVEDGMVSGGEVSEAGVPFINIWKLDLPRTGQASPGLALRSVTPRAS